MYEKVIRDNVHGDIYFDHPIYIEIINSSEMQRLRRILQLAGSQFAYPSATHTRFSHCIGVYHVLKQFLKNNDFKMIDEKDQMLVKLAGLLHDVGHAAFSHTFERITNKSHESYTTEIIKNVDGNINKILKKYDIDPDDIVAIIEGTYKNNIINLLVSSQIDADRFDYLIRDSYNCGVDYATLDVKWLIRNAKIRDNKIVFPHKTIYAIESYLLGRYHMYQQVYNHKTSISFDVMFSTWFKRIKYLAKNNYKFKDNRIYELFGSLFEKKSIKLNEYLQIDDYLMFNIFANCQNEQDQILSDLSKRINNRELFVCKSEQLVEKDKIFDKLKEKGYDPEYYLLKTVSKPAVMYKIEHEAKKDEHIYLFNEKTNKIDALENISLLSCAIRENNNQKNEIKYLFPKELEIK
ncbi:HD domain-containing protein [Mycoplasma sp. HU2014]|uniref:HD domain-containing protein n=1 Tax=Mycoplasma sp. HU2014 TaxID=1664275 RepID=UPI00067E0546|nr:HD domain-containing protein [Mycoplasma sp. HU2014]KNG79446.1 HD family phosphohydrolase [Mycoplasma sp. HU2014]